LIKYLKERKNRMGKALIQGGQKITLDVDLFYIYKQSKYPSYFAFIIDYFKSKTGNAIESGKYRRA